jgi:hypothetical protein
MKENCPFVYSTNPGQRTPSGTYKYASGNLPRVGISTNIPHYSREYPLAGIPSASSYMLTRQNFRVLVQLKGTLWLRVVPTFLRVLETATVSVVGVLLDGYHLYVHTRISSSLLIKVFARSRKIGKKKISPNSRLSNVHYGINPFL